MKYYRYAAILSWIFVSVNCIAEDISFDFDELAISSDQVFTAARMDQSVKDTPGAITVISGKQIRELGIKTVSDVMMLVPGFNVAYFGGISYVNRGNTSPTPRRLQVLVDGISQVNTLVGVVLWDILPVPIENIARVEVIRSQASASYGANSFLGAVNIITRHPDDRLGAELHVYGSERGGSGYAGYATRVGNTSVAFDFKNYRYDRYDTRINSGNPKNDDSELDIMSAHSVTRLGTGNTFNFSASGARGDVESDASQTVWGINYPVVELTLFESEAEYEHTTQERTTSLSLAITDKDQNWHWDVCGPRGFFNPELGQSFNAYLNSGIDLSSFQFGSLSRLSELEEVVARLLLDPSSYDLVCGNTQIDYHYRTYEMELNDVWSINDQLRLSSALQLNYKMIDSEMYGNGKTILEKSELFTNLEYRIGDAMTINAGVFVEALNFELNNPQFSPRVGFNFHLTPSSTIKFVVSKGKRLIDGVELIEEIKTPTHFPYEVYGSTTQYAFFTYGYKYTNRNHVEEIDSVELIYYLKNRSFELESRIYKESMSNIYNHGGALSLPGRKSADILREGFDLSAVKSLLDYELRVSAYFIDSHSDNITYDQYNYYGGSAYIIKYFPHEVVGAIGYYGRSKYYYGTDTANSPASERLYNECGRFDLRISKNWSFDDTQLDLELLYSHHNDAYDVPVILFSVPDDTAKRDNKSEITLGFTLQF